LIDLDGPDGFVQLRTAGDWLRHSGSICPLFLFPWACGSLVRPPRSDICGRSRGCIWAPSVWFWAALGIWALFRSIAATVPFDYTARTASIVLVVVNGQLFLVAVSIGVLSLCQCASFYRRATRDPFAFHRATICVFLLVSLAIAAVVAGANRSDPPELARPMGIWVAATGLFVPSAAVIPSRRVFRRVLPAKRSSTGSGSPSAPPRPRDLRF
jgi:hypothetical protein